ncbi:hypothetical protein Q8791_08840 [Nocardiopsis sp. CT-R113]|uniref:Lipoprotein n=1 Tax=Nocardiopsis codii TaxID=3065942 RepID=A0ABU7K501_9ACTN|nr:hypothetical protein [Nocardiopsis sp. CT-R113]MEE2037326.1 hypothetical protein [Nocardiopsis sp. CT-R113]
MASSIRLAAAAAVILLGVTAVGCGATGDRAPVRSVGGRESTAPALRAPEAPDPSAETLSGEAEPHPAPGADLGADPAGEPLSTPGPAAEEPAPGTRETAAEAPEGAVTAYVRALASGDPARMVEGLEHAAEGSVAHDYLTHQASVARARVDAGLPVAAAETEHTADGYELCTADDPRGDPTCSSHGGFTGADGLVGGLLVDGGDPGPGLLVPGPDERPEVKSEGVTATLLTAYRSAADKTLVVTVGFDTRENVDLDLHGTAYQGRNGHESAVRAAVGRHELDAGTRARAAFFLSGAAPGGNLRVGGCLEECSSFVFLGVPVE